MFQLKKEFEEIKKQLNFFPEKEKEEKLFEYVNLILKYNEKVNLTSIKNLKDFLRLQIFDFYPLLEVKFYENVIDIGAGAGFLIVPLSIFYKNINLVALEPNKKKAFFLNILKKNLSLNFEVKEMRLEDYLVDFNKIADFLIKALPKKEKIFNFLSKKFQKDFRIFYFSGKNYKAFLNSIKMCYSLLDMKKIPLRKDSYIIILKNVSRETWGEL